MTLDDLITQLNKTARDFSPGGEAQQSVLRTAASNCLDLVKRRIHDEGLAADGSDIGSYNATKALYVNPNNSPMSFTPEGKNGVRKSKKTKGLTRPRVTKYFASYSEFKEFIGKGGKVDLVLFGGLENQLSLIENGSDVGIGWMPGELASEGSKTSQQSYFDRAKALEAKYGKTIWALSEDEQNAAIAIAQDVTNQYLQNAIS